MNLQTHVREELWKEISSTYEAKNYCGAIIDAMKYLSYLIREKTGAEGDGQALVGQAFGGDQPLLRINKFQTDTEKSEQRGFEQILRGLYMAIRNPRSHDQIEDNQINADAIIYFINYLIDKIDKSSEPFSFEKYLEQVFDPDFVEEDHYAEVLAKEIPAKKRLDVLIQIYRQRCDGDTKKIRFMINAILDLLPEHQIEDYYNVVSEELRTIGDQSGLIKCMEIIPEQQWIKVSEVARLKVENKLLISMTEGEYDFAKRKLLKGGLGTFASGILEYYTNKEKVTAVILTKLAGSMSHRDYILNWFFGDLPKLFISERQKSQCIYWISKAIRNGENFARNKLVSVIRSFPIEWQRSFADELKDLTNAKYPATCLSDGSPFLSKIGGNLSLLEEPPDEWFVDLTIEPEFKEDDVSELPPSLDWIMRPPEGWDEDTSSTEGEIPF
jgi:uncharacterized protein (TIGR02391 family)